MKSSLTDMDTSTAVTIAKWCVGALMTIATTLASFLVVRVVKWVRWWMTQEAKFARLAAFETEVMGDPSTGKIGLRDRITQAEAAAAKASNDVAQLYATFGLTPGQMHALQLGAIREAVRLQLVGRRAAQEDGDVFSGVREHFNPEDTGRGRRMAAGAVDPSPLPPRRETPRFMDRVTGSPSWESSWKGKPPDSDKPPDDESGE